MILFHFGRVRLVCMLGLGLGFFVRVRVMFFCMLGLGFFVYLRLGLGLVLCYVGVRVVHFITQML